MPHNVSCAFHLPDPLQLCTVLPPRLSTKYSTISRQNRLTLLYPLLQAHTTATTAGQVSMSAAQRRCLHRCTL